MKLNKKLILIASLLTILLACRTVEDKSIHQKIVKDTERIFDNLVQIRRDLHQHPELAGDEIRTSKIIAKYLADLGLEVKTGIAGNGVIGILKGNRNGKNIAWRADMDAIPSDFPDKVSFKSTNKGVQHGCGHDIHIAIGLGIAEILSKNKESINGTVYFIFQPEEETFVGAKNMVNNNIYQELQIDEIYALHVTALPVGQILARPEEIFAYQKILQIKFDGKFSEKDSKEFHSQIRREVQRLKDTTDPWQISKAFDSVAGIGNPNTLFQDYLFVDEHFSIKKDKNELVLTATIYETNKSRLADILPKIEQVISTSEHKDKFISMSYIQENPTVLNHKALTKQAVNTINHIYGNNTVAPNYGQIPYFNDDFTYFQQKTPGVYFLLGGSNPEKGLVAMNHAPNFAVDEECIKVGVKSFSSLIMERANVE
ncbi:M20 metallopeptidase family protein [Maribacter sp. 2307UL18-2]|uniref:M20 metallopeptidase family protein n=1 Tax=Maribacter sp. 2307UL18-2 TaxID=3386274 RepID=UPI0039BC2937